MQSAGEIKWGDGGGKSGCRGKLTQALWHWVSALGQYSLVSLAGISRFADRWIWCSSGNRWP